MGAACCTSGTAPDQGGCCRRAPAAEESGEACALVAQEDIGGGKGGDDLEDLRREAARLDNQRAADAAAGPPSAVEGVRAALAAAEARALAAKQSAYPASTDANGQTQAVPEPAAVAQQQFSTGGLAVPAGTAKPPAGNTPAGGMQFEVSWDGKGYVGKTDSSKSGGGGSAPAGMDMNGMMGIEEGSSEEEDEPQSMPVTTSMIPEVEAAPEPEAAPAAEEAKPQKKRRTWSFSFRRKSAK